MLLSDLGDSTVSLLWSENGCGVELLGSDVDVNELGMYDPLRISTCALDNSEDASG